MNRIERAMRELYAIDHEAASPGWLQSIHPLPKVLVTLTYLVVLLSFRKYQLTGVLLMGIYPIVLFLLGEISVARMGRRLWAILLLVSLIGIANPWFDRTPLFSLGSITLTGGVISLLTLMLKGLFAVSAAYLLIVSTTMDDICHVLRTLHVPSVLVTVLMLVYRYLMVFLKEAGRLSDAYALRAPGERGVRFQAWGSMIGQLLLRSIDRAEVVYESMQLRGFQGEFKARQDRPTRTMDTAYALFWIALFLILRWI